ncbi:hypothetical protein GOBAR_DD32863 [Gossypium barbadense]|nr:hypothetical protein GOBAR_DD32863 [Gossypium barbadense]
MELADDEDVETMVDLYCGNGSDKNAPIHLFAELAGMEQNEDVNASDEEHGAQEPCMVAPISYVDSESTMGGMGIDLNITPDVDMVGGEEECGCEEKGGGDHWDEEVDSDGDPDVDDVPDDIDDEDINASSIGEQMQHIILLGHGNNMPWDSDHAGPLWPIPHVAACAGGLQSTGLRINMASRNYSTIEYTLMTVASR